MFRYVSGVLLLISANAVAIDHPTFGYVSPDKADGGVIGLQYDCEYQQTAKDGASLECRFLRLTLKSYDDVEVRRGLEARAKEIRQLNDDEFEKALAEVISPMRANCADLTGENQYLEAYKKTGQPSKQGEEILKKSYLILKEFSCGDNKPTRDELIKALTDLSQIESHTCWISIFEYSRTFKYLDEKTWVLNEGPGPICGLVSIHTFSKDGESFPVWNYSERTITTKQDQDEEFCAKQNRDETLNYEWINHAKAIPEKCIWIKMGY